MDYKCAKAGQHASGFTATITPDSPKANDQVTTIFDYVSGVAWQYWAYLAGARTGTRTATFPLTLTPLLPYPAPHFRTWMRT